MNLTKTLTTREKTLLLILAAIIVAVVYYMVIWQPSAQTIAAAETRMAQVENNLVTEQATAKRIAEMQAELAAVAEDAEAGTITPLFDNANNLLSALNPALADTANLKMSFGDPQFDNDIATRSLRISFDVSNYEQARTVIGNISGGPYRNNVVSMTIAKTARYGDYDWYEDADDSAQSAVDAYVSVSLTVNYYEIYKTPEAASGAETADGGEVSDETES